MEQQHKSTWRLIVEWGIFPLVLGLFVAGVIVYYADHSDAAPPQATTLSVAARCVPPDPTMTCTQWADSWGHHKARQFRHHKLGTAKGYTLPLRWRRAFNRWARNHPAANARLERRGDGHWWNWPLEAVMCTPIAGAGYKVACNSAAKHQRQFNKGVVRITVVCGGAAAVGALAGGGAAGAGKGALACLWANLALAVFQSNDWLHFRWGTVDRTFRLDGPIW